MSHKQFDLTNVSSFFHDVETPVLSFWKENSIFEKSVTQRPESDHFVFYDGPPFVTGTPHYGHLLSSILKDIIPRYQTMKGKRVERVWGWDCHGLPVEEKVERTLGTKNRRDIENVVGIQKFIDACVAYVKDTSAEWPWYVDRIARWVDMEKPYRTMDKNYMESVIWVFKQLYEKELVYKGKRVSLYCTRCGTPISNFEVAMDNSYADLEDPSVYVKFKAKYHKTGLGVGIVIKNEKGEILMMRRNEPGREQVWGIVGGKVEESDKSLEETVRREMVEEIGLEPTNIQYYTYSIDLFEGRLFKTYHVAATITGIPKLQDENIGTELKWFAAKDLPWEDMHIPTRNCLKEALEGTPRTESNYSTHKPDVYIVAWTTTPWTLPSNAALAIDKEKEYVSFSFQGKEEILVVAKERLEHVVKDEPYTLVDTFLGKDLIKLPYEQLFSYFDSAENDYRVYAADFVSMGDGTGIVHVAPGYGEDDTELGKEHKLSVFDAVNDEGKLIEKVTDFAGQYIKDADNEIIANLTERNLMLRAEKAVHSYPLCYRCQTPLIYKAQDSWYVDIATLRPQLEANNEGIHWVPEHLKQGRFLAGIKSAPDWGVSRTRYWATPMPIWECDKCETRDVLGSIAEIEEKSGKKVTDLHRPYIDEHTYACKCGGTMTRVEEVLDCWLESASMPFAQFHYPFENKEKFENNFPGDYIVEYIPQTRAWFYVMHVISTALFGKNAFRNAIGTGTINGTDGRKMSKSYGNYPDPKQILEKFGGDAFRMSMANSVLTHGEDVNVSEELIGQQVKDLLMPLMNIYKYFGLYANQHNVEPRFGVASNNILDKWVLARVKQATQQIQTGLDAYDVQGAARELKPMLDDVSTWYIRRSRDRFVAGDNEAISTLFTTLFLVLRAMAPFTPFIAEFLYLRIKHALPEMMQLESIHLHLFDGFNEVSTDEQTLLDDMEHVRTTASLALSIRDEKQLPVKQPLSSVTFAAPHELTQEMLELIQSEVNVLSISQVATAGDIPQTFERKDKEDLSVALDIALTPELIEKGVVREVIRAIQVSRKKSGFELGEKAKATLTTHEEALVDIVNKYADTISSQTGLASLKVNKAIVEGEHGELFTLKQGEYPLAVSLEH